MKKKKIEKESKETNADEPLPTYNNSITITTLADLEERDRDHTRNMTHDQRMEYLQKLISITHSNDDLKKVENIFNEGRIKIKKPE